MLTRRGRAYRFRERLFNRANSFLLPQMSRSLREEEADEAFGSTTDDAAPNHIKIVDRGSDTTVVSFSSAALLHAGEPTREFEGFFQRHGKDYNLVFLRDVHRSAYHLTPSGEPSGLAFHEAELRGALAALGSRRHVAIGDSGGAAAAIYFGTRLGFDRVVAFSPPFPLRYWIGPVAQLRAYFNAPLLLREPGAYWEHVVLASTTAFMFLLPIGLKCGFKNIWDPVAEYVAAVRRPQMTIYYGEGSRPETNILRPLRDCADVDIRPLPTARHFCMVALARTGRLGPAIMEAIDPPAASA